MYRLLVSIVCCMGLIVSGCTKGDSEEISYSTTGTSQLIAGSVTVNASTGDSVGESGYVDGQRLTASKFNYPQSVLVHQSGDLIVADTSNRRIRRINLSTGIVETIAGSGVRSCVDGDGASATFLWPSGLAQDSNGDIYIADYSCNKIRKIDKSTNVVTTYAGNGTSATLDDTNPLNASFDGPAGVDVGSDNSVFVITAKGGVRKISSTGNVTTLAASLNGWGISVDPSNDDIYVSLNDHTIRKIDSDNTVTLIAGTANSEGSADGIGEQARFNIPEDVDVDSDGNLIISDLQNSCIRKIDRSSNVTTVFGICGTAGYLEGGYLTALLNGAISLDIDADGNWYIADYRNHVIRKISF